MAKKRSRQEAFDSITFSKVFIGYNRDAIIAKLTALGFVKAGDDRKWDSNLFLMISDRQFYPAGERHYIDSPFTVVKPEEILGLEWEEGDTLPQQKVPDMLGMVIRAEARKVAEETMDRVLAFMRECRPETCENWAEFEYMFREAFLGCDGKPE